MAERRVLTEPGPETGRVAPMPALDGLRACAVLAVIGYHSALGWLRGGYYGVDAFLVLSGFLITTLLLAEHQGHGAISLGRFWARRARRLLPGLFLMLAGVAVVAGCWPGFLSTTHLFTDAVASLLYVGNWHLAAEHASYFDAYQGQSPLLHTWTLAIEEQFYLIWPLVVVAVLRWGHRVGGRGRRRGGLGLVCCLALAGAAGSAVEMIVLAPGGSADPSRVYYGSDTRAQGLLLGAALAAACALWGPVRSRGGRRALTGLGVAGAGGVAVMWAAVPETSWLSFHGGFVLITLSCLAVVAAAARAPGSGVARVLGLAPLRYLGRISYGMYLWYWPVLLVMTGARVGWRGYPLLGARLVVIVALAALSYHLVETPIRRGALPGWYGAIGAPAAALGVAGGVLLSVTVAPVAAPLDGSFLTASSVRAPRSSVVLAPATPVAAAPAPAAGSPSTADHPAGPSSARSGPGRLARAARPATDGTAAGGLSPTLAPPPPVRIMLVGDSMAGTLSVGLAQVAPQYGAEVVDEGMAGCSLAMDGQIKVLALQLDPASPCVAGRPQVLVDEMGAWVRRYQPDVVVYLARGEILTQQHAGQWQHLGQATFDAWVRTRFQSVVPVLGATGAKVVLMTTPFFSTGEEANGDPWPEDDPARVVADNAIIASVARVGGASLIDLNRLVSPSGHYAAAIDGVSLRCRDGSHFTPSGGRWLGRALLPTLVALGRAHSVLAAAQVRTAVLPPTVPFWYPKLPCGA